LQALFAAGRFASLRRRAADLDDVLTRSPLAGLLDRLSPPASPPPRERLPATSGDAGTAPAATDVATAAAVAVAESTDELKSVRYFRDNWSKLSIERELAEAQPPENAGPLNSHLLVLRALERLQTVSPDYLHRFAPYAEALLWLEQADGLDGVPGGAGEGERRRKSERSAGNRAVRR